MRTQFDWWGASRARVTIPLLRDHSPEPKRSFGNPSLTASSTPSILPAASTSLTPPSQRDENAVRLVGRVTRQGYNPAFAGSLSRAKAQLWQSLPHRQLYPFHFTSRFH